MKCWGWIRACLMAKVYCDLRSRAHEQLTIVMLICTMVWWGTSSWILMGTYWHWAKGKKCFWSHPYVIKGSYNWTLPSFYSKERWCKYLWSVRVQTPSKITLHPQNGNSTLHLSGTEQKFSNQSSNLSTGLNHLNSGFWIVKIYTLRAPSAGSATWGLGFGLSTTIACVVRTIPATEAAFWSAHLVTLAGSITPDSIRFSYLSVIALYPTSHSLSLTFSTTTSPSTPALCAINEAGATNACRSWQIL